MTGSEIESVAFPGLRRLVIALLFSGFAASAATVLQIGQSYTASSYGIDSGAIPPDAGLGVGPGHLVEFINGRFSVFGKADGTEVQTMSDVAFWVNAGLPASFVSDPRIFYDPGSQRWFASMVDVPSSGPNRFRLAVSMTSNPTGKWKAREWFADPLTGDFADFPTLGIDADAVYLAGDMYDSLDNPVGSVIVAIPKADLLEDPPTVTNRTSFGVLPSAFGEVLQPAITLTPAAGGEAVLAAGNLGYDFAPHSNLVTFAVQNAATATASLLAPVSLAVPAYVVPLNPPQPGGVDNLDDGDARFAASVYRVGDLVYAIHAVQLNGRTALQWFQINAATRAVVGSGHIAHPVLHYFYPAIAANGAGTVVVVFNSCGTNAFISSYAVVGEPVNGVLTFHEPLLLNAGTVAYRTNNPATISRWGDYSAVTPDPSDPARFWSLTMYPDSSTDWSTQIDELITGPLRLDITLAGNVVHVSWPSSAADFQLQTKASLQTAAWTNAGQAPTITNGLATVSLPVSGTSGFFRLIK